MVNLIQQNVALQWCVSQENTFPLALLPSNNSHWPIDHMQEGGCVFKVVMFNTCLAHLHTSHIKFGLSRQSVAEAHTS